LDNDFIRTVYRAPSSNRDVRQRLLIDGDPTLAGLPTDRGIGGSSRGLSAAASRTLRDFSYKAEYAFDYGMPQWLARVDSLVSPLRLENLFLGRHKMFHFRVWYRDALASYIKEMLLDSRTLARPYLQPRAVEAIVHGHVTGARNYTADIHRLLSLELVHRLFVDAQ
jgi:asparagine synthase (glutamine-hydrolysing)